MQCLESRERDTCVTKRGTWQDSLRLCDGEGKDRLAGESQGDRQEREGVCSGSKWMCSGSQGDAEEKGALLPSVL